MHCHLHAVAARSVKLAISAMHNERDVSFLEAFAKQRTVTVADASSTATSVSRRDRTHHHPCPYRLETLAICMADCGVWFALRQLRSATARGFDRATQKARRYGLAEDVLSLANPYERSRVRAHHHKRNVSFLECCLERFAVSIRQEVIYDRDIDRCPIEAFEGARDAGTGGDNLGACFREHRAVFQGDKRFILNDKNSLAG
jgi:hypothetical protein